MKYRPNKFEQVVIQSAGDISDISTCAANTNATGPGITAANLGSKATFTITSRDSQNFQRKRGGDVFVVKLQPEKGRDEIKVELKDRKDGTYLAEYTVDKLYGKLTLSVCLRGEHIKGSPFVVSLLFVRIISIIHLYCLGLRCLNCKKKLDKLAKFSFDEARGTTRRRQKRHCSLNSLSCHFNMTNGYLQRGRFDLFSRRRNLRKENCWVPAPGATSSYHWYTLNKN